MVCRNNNCKVTFFTGIMFGHDKHFFLLLFTMIAIPVTDSLEKQKFSVFLSSYRNASGRLGEYEIMWEHDVNKIVYTAFSFTLILSQVLLQRYENI